MKALPIMLFLWDLSLGLPLTIGIINALLHKKIKRAALHRLWLYVCNTLLQIDEQL